ncbi:hypothetical protein VP01_9557g1 [Puccinia sorghi]|uniref:Uncharacterized protein n=1 Tax=Puccinia sorghi TaxID=27349 RepID=A0A0L6U8D9_9BASI|nr:hypothetical protein VP01_9557g1 [Puccinia sorghi]
MMFRICVCSQFETKNTTGTNGKTIPGQRVHPTTHQRHWAQQSSPLNSRKNHEVTLPSATLPDETSEEEDEDPQAADIKSEAECIRKLPNHFSFEKDVLTPVNVFLELL